MQFFIMGTGRSGTSIFNKIVGQHKCIWSFRWESQIFSGVPALADLVDSKSSKRLVNDFSIRCREHLYKRNVGGRYDAGLFELVDEAEFHTLLNKLCLDIENSGSNQDKRATACREFADSLFFKCAKKEGKDIWCEKTPRNLLYADKIQLMYPDAKFINVIRDGREVISSILERKFWPVAKSTRFQETSFFGGEFTVENAVRYWVALMHITETVKTRV